MTEAEVEVGVAVVVPQSNTGSNIEVAKLQIIHRAINKVLGFLTACKLFIRMKMRETTVEEQIQWMLFYMQERLVDI